MFDSNENKAVRDRRYMPVRVVGYWKYRTKDLPVDKNSKV